MPELYAWSAAGNASGFFGVARVAAEGITVQPSTGNSRLVRRTDFESIFPLWAGYRDGKVQRQALRDRSRNSTYIVSILHWLEIQP